MKFDIQEDTLFCFGRLIFNQGSRGVPIGGFLSAHLAELWCAWKEEMHLFGFLRTEVEAKVSAEIQQGFPQASPVTLTLLGHSDFTISPHQSMNMQCVGNMMRAPGISGIKVSDLDQGGFYGWWSPTDTLIGTLQTLQGSIHLVHTLPWDGAAGGRMASIIQETERQNKS